MAILNKGQVWETDSRKGILTVRLLEKVNTHKDDFFQAEVLVGKARYMSDAYRLEQMDSGMGMEGSIIPFRTSLVGFRKRFKELEMKKK